MLDIARPLGGVNFLVIAISMSLCTLAWMRGAGRPDVASRDALFVGIGALAERNLQRVFEDSFGPADVERVDETDARTLLALHRPDLRLLLQSCLAAMRAIRPYLTSGVIAGFSARDLQLWAGLRLWRYAFFLTWFESYRHRSGIRAIGMSAASEVAFAAVQSGAPVVYLPHGFQRSSLVFPDFGEVRAGNEVEARHFRRRLPGTRVTRLPTPPPLDRTDRLALVAGHYGTLDELRRADDFLAWARDAEFPVVIRPHPRDATGYWDGWRHKEGVSFNETGEPFDAAIVRLRPRLLVTWGSTTLFDAIARGVIAVSLATDAPHELDLVVRFDTFTFAWPRDRGKVARLAASSAAAARAARKQREGVLPQGV